MKISLLIDDQVVSEVFKEANEINTEERDLRISRVISELQIACNSYGDLDLLKRFVKNRAIEIKHILGGQDDRN